MPANECMPYYEPGSRITGHASANITGKRFVAISGNIQSGPGLSATSEGGNLQVAHAAAGAKAFGVSGYDVPSGSKIPILNGPGMVVPVTAGANIAAGAEVEVGSAGQAITLASGKAVGMCLTAATSGADAMVRLYT